MTCFTHSIFLVFELFKDPIPLGKKNFQVTISPLQIQEILIDMEERPLVYLTRKILNTAILLFEAGLKRKGSSIFNFYCDDLS